MTHDELRQLVPIFALDALPSEDEAELVAHLKICRECSVMLTEHLETAGMLALSASSIQPPGDLKDRIMQQAARTPQLTTAPAAQAPARAPAPVQRRRTPAWRWQLAGLAAACAFALVVGGVVVQQLNRQQGVLAAQQEALDIISSPSSVAVAMAPTRDGRGAAGKVFVSGDGDEAAVLVRGLQDPGDDVYTLWVIEDGDPAPVEDFLPDDGVTAIKVDQPVDSDTTLAVTREPNRGNTSPKGPMLLASA